MITINKPYLKKSNGIFRICSDIQIGKENKTLYYEADGVEESNFCIERADAFLVGLLPLAMKKGESINIKYSISEKLFFQLTEFYIPILARYQNSMNRINICADQLVNTVTKNREGVATGVSGGVDSFYSICKYYNFNVKMVDYLKKALIYGHTSRISS